MRLVRESAVWLGVGAAPAAWAAQLVLSSELEETACARGGMEFSVDTHKWHLVLTAAPALVAAAGIAAAMYAYAATRDGDPRGRAGFLAVAGLLGSVLFLALILLGGIGALYLGRCHPS